MTPTQEELRLTLLQLDHARNMVSVAESTASDWLQIVTSLERSARRLAGDIAPIPATPDPHDVRRYDDAMAPVVTDAKQCCRHGENAITIGEIMADAEPAAPPELAAPRWQDRLTFDPAVSESSPVVKGTQVTVAHLIDMVVDGHTWSDILRIHPELDEGDIQACLTYATSQDTPVSREITIDGMFPQPIGDAIAAEAIRDVLPPGDDEHYF